eukprot:UN03972
MNHVNNIIIILLVLILACIINTSYAAIEFCSDQLRCPTYRTQQDCAQCYQLCRWQLSTLNDGRVTIVAPDGTFQSTNGRCVPLNPT